MSSHAVTCDALLPADKVLSLETAFGEGYRNLKEGGKTVILEVARGVRSKPEEER